MTGNELYTHLNGFVEHLRDQGRSSKTITIYRQKVRHFCQWAADERVTIRLVFAYREYLQTEKEKPRSDDRGCRPRTVRAALGALRCYWRYLASIGVEGLPDITAVPPPPMDAPQREVPSVAQVRQLFAAAGRIGLQSADPRYGSFLRTRALAVLSLAFGCALRRDELLRLDVQDVRLDVGRVNIRRGKGGKSRWVSIGDRECDQLREWLQVRQARLVRQGKTLEALFIDDKGRRMGHHSIESLMRTLKALAGLEDTKISLHGLRHRAGSILVKEMGPKAAQVVLGHASITTTLEVYTHLDDNEIEHAAQRLSSAIHTSDDQARNESPVPASLSRRPALRRTAGLRRR